MSSDQDVHILSCIGDTNCTLTSWAKQHNLSLLWTDEVQDNDWGQTENVG